MKKALFVVATLVVILLIGCTSGTDHTYSSQPGYGNIDDVSCSQAATAAEQDNEKTVKKQRRPPHK